MAMRVLESSAAYIIEAGQELVDAVVAAVDVDRPGEVDRVRRALEPLGLAEAFTSELRLSGVATVCNGDCWSPELSEVA